MLKVNFKPASYGYNEQTNNILKKTKTETADEIRYALIIKY